ncbi:hypothetical protein TNCV_1821071 [Trichonephila clavipes]|nr:hypothetical protein TNCV_1821071 [Trichonephila clavipes]
MSSFLEFCEGDTRNRWRDGQVCPDVDKELWRLGSDGSGVFLALDKCVQMWTRNYGALGQTARETRGKKNRKSGKRTRDTERERAEGGGETEKRERGDGKRLKESRGERENEARLEWRKGLSPEIGVKKTMNAGGVENGL